MTDRARDWQEAMERWQWEEHCEEEMREEMMVDDGQQQIDALIERHDFELWLRSGSPVWTGDRFSGSRHPADMQRPSR